MSPQDTNKSISLLSDKVFYMDQSPAVQRYHWKDSEKVHENTESELIRRSGC